MIDHFEIKTVHFEQCRDFYAAVLPSLGIEMKWSDAHAAGFGQVGEDRVRFLIEKSNTACPSHIAFSAKDEASVHGFHAEGVASGHQCNGEPGLRKNYAPNYFAAFLLDPDGNNVEAVILL